MTKQIGLVMILALLHYNKTERTVESEKRVIQSESVEDGIAH